MSIKLRPKHAGPAITVHKNVEFHFDISKQIVAEAERSGRGIAIEDLGGIRERVQGGGRQRAILHLWAFSQLRQFLESKSRLAGVAIVTVDPHHTSRRCSHCGHCEKKNRLRQCLFRCRVCGHDAHADINAAENIRGELVNQPYLAMCVVRIPAKSRRFQATVVYFQHLPQLTGISVYRLGVTNPAGV